MNPEPLFDRISLIFRHKKEEMPSVHSANTNLATKSKNSPSLSAKRENFLDVWNASQVDCPIPSRFPDTHQPLQ